MGRPKKGQKAASIARREQERRESAIRRLQWLRDLRTGATHLPAGYTSFTLTSFCAYESEDPPFIAQSPNNLKRHLALLGSDTIGEVKGILASLRRHNSGAIDNKDRARTESLANARRINKDLRQQIQALVDDLITLRVAYNNLVKMIENEPTKHNAIRRAIKEQKDRLGLRLISGKTNG